MSRAMALPDDSPRVRESDPITSHEAADVTVGKRHASQAVVLRILMDAGVPLTDEEIHNEADSFAMYSASRLRTARHELVEQGRVVAKGTVLPDGHRTRMTVWGLA